MRVSCPSCGATYEIPDDILVAGRRLRCARCTHEWAPEPPFVPGRPVAAGTDPPPPPAISNPGANPGANPAPAPASIMPATDAGTEDMLRDVAIPPPPPPLVATPPLVEPRESAARPATVAAAWAASLVVLALLAAAAYSFRDAVQSGWPPSRAVYAALGLD